MELWYYFLEKLTLRGPKGGRGLKRDDAYLCCQVAELEGQMDALFRSGGTDSNHWKAVSAHDKQSRLRDYFVANFPNDPLPDKLKPGYKPKGSLSE